MTSPSAQKAAGEASDKIARQAITYRKDGSVAMYDHFKGESIIQQAITEAVDAAVAQEKERTTKIATRMKTAAAVNGHDAYAQKVLRVFADELESLVKNESEEK